MNIRQAISRYFCCRSFQWTRSRPIQEPSFLIRPGVKNIVSCGIFLIQTPRCEYMTELRGVLYLFRQLTAVDINCKNWNSWGPFGFVHMGSRYENMIGAPSLKTHNVTLKGFQRMLSRLRKFHRYIFPGSWQAAFKSPVIVSHGWK